MEWKQPNLSTSTSTGDWLWRFWLAVPLYPYSKRRTVRKEVVKDTIWTFDQLQGILYTVVPIRMSVVKLEKGGLLVYAPVAPTKECIRLLKELEALHGAVKYIILTQSFRWPLCQKISGFAGFRDCEPVELPAKSTFELAWLPQPANSDTSSS